MRGLRCLHLTVHVFIVSQFLFEIDTVASYLAEVHFNSGSQQYIIRESNNEEELTETWLFGVVLSVPGRKINLSADRRKVVLVRGMLPKRPPIFSTLFNGDVILWLCVYKYVFSFYLGLPYLYIQVLSSSPA